ncbi:MAG: FG-GAP repeat protein [Immundisolibacteraceae bacterium]|nr:FG-GAP repeat protein [Immundisolibacteraceae bacterium]
MGLGWGIGGQSSISRCGTNPIIDNGLIDPIDFDSNDKLCLDGQRLILISGTYGAAGSEYHTELDSFSRITAISAAGNMPAYFKVQTKAGLTRWYGSTSDSRIEASGSSEVLVWTLSVMDDSTGNNRMEYRYTENNANGEYRLRDIRYTYEPSQSGDTAPARVLFEYETRPDIVTQYVGRHPVKITQRLTNVKTYTKAVGGGSYIGIKDYQVSYTTSALSSARSQVASITECDQAGNCLPAATFDWLAGSAGFDSNNTAVNIPTGDWKTKYALIGGDYNGDGIEDFIRAGDSSIKDTYFCPGPGITSCTKINDDGNWLTNYDIYPGDYNGDGITDLYQIGTNHSRLCLGPGIASGDNCNQVHSSNWKTTYSDIIPADFNGDGKTDLVLINMPGSVLTASYLCTNVENSSSGCVTFNAAIPPLPNSVNPYVKASFSVGDFNGDGLADLLVTEKTGSGDEWISVSNHHIKAIYGPLTTSSTIKGFFTSDTAPWSPPDSIYTPLVGDFDGDGQSDFLITAYDLFKYGATGALLFCTSADQNICTEVNVGI